MVPPHSGLVFTTQLVQLSNSDSERGRSKSDIGPDSTFGNPSKISAHAFIAYSDITVNGQLLTFRLRLLTVNSVSVQKTDAFALA